MTTSAVRAYYLEDGNYLDILFDDAIDISAATSFADITLYYGSGTAVAAASGSTFQTTADSKYIRINPGSAFATAVEGWTDAQKKAAGLVMNSGALTDINGDTTPALGYAAGIRCHFVVESSLNTTFANYHAAGETVYLPRNANITQNIAALDQPLSNGIVKFEGYDASTVITGDIVVGDASLACSAADPLVLELERMTYNGNLKFNKIYLEDTGNDTDDIKIPDTTEGNEYQAFKVTSVAAALISAVKVKMKAETSFAVSGLSGYIYSDNSGVPGTILSTLTPSGATSFSQSYQTITWSADTSFAATTSYWVVFKNTSNLYDIYILGDATGGTNLWAYSDDGASWTNSNQEAWFQIEYSGSQYLGGGMKNVIWNGSYQYGSAYYFAGLAIANALYKWTLDRCNWKSDYAHTPGAEETSWNIINSKLVNDSDSATLFTTSNLSMVMSYCESVSGTATFSGGSNLTIFNCKDNNTIPSNVSNDTTNASGLTGLSLSNSQGYGYIGGGSLNAGRAFTQLDGGDSPGERSVGVPRGSMVGVGAFSAIPAKVITPTSATVSGTTITYQLPADSFDSGDNVRVVLNNVEDTAGNVIARDTILTATAS